VVELDLALLPVVELRREIRERHRVEALAVAPAAGQRVVLLRADDLARRRRGGHRAEEQRGQEEGSHDH
jgi:hypothetical protein